MPPPLISLVVPTFNVARYLPEFLASLDAQVGGLADVQIVFCDDGSTDGSGDLQATWVARRPELSAELITKANGGLSSARNAGLAAATGEWVSFPDPDDVLTPTYLAVVREFLGSPAAHGVDLAAANLVWREDSGDTEDSHPLNYRFAEHHRVVDLESEPTYIHLHANTGFYRRAGLVEAGLRFDERIVPNFEDGHLTGLYLVRSDRPRIAFLDDAVYHYRRRSDGTSLVQGSWTKAGKYLNVPRHGWLDLLARAADRQGRAPVWAQNLVLYDLFRYLRAERRPNSPTTGIPAAWKAEFLAVLTEVLAHIDPATIAEYRIKRTPVENKRALLLGILGIDARPREAFLDRLDQRQALVCLRYHYRGPAPLEQIRADGEPIRAVFAKTRRVEFYGRTLLHERIAWLPSDATLTLTLDGRSVALVVGAPALPRYSVGADALRAGLAPAPAKAPRQAQVPVQALTARRLARLVGARARRPAAPPGGAAPGRYDGAWLLMDRDDQAQDNAEHLYRYLRTQQRQVNAYFVLSERSPDWPRLRAEGFALLAFGSPEHAAALERCAHVISSQIDHYVVQPVRVKRPGRPRARYTFLQHGVTHNDLSTWINPKPISLMITATADEHASLVGDGTAYVLTDKEVKLTGFPRHDRLRALAEAQPTEPLLLVMPTWRRHLLAESVGGGNSRGLLADFWDSEYARAWRAVLESERLHAVAEAHGWRIAFVPHPNLAGYLDTSPLPAHVQVHRFTEIDVQQLLARGGLMVTDYSSLAFELAYLNRPVIYHQFDRDRFFDGTHAFTRGTWSYEEQGFGPVTTRAEEAVDAAVALVEAGGTPDPVYAARMRSTFAFRDGECAARTYEAIADLDRPLAPAQRFIRVGEAHAPATR